MAGMLPSDLSLGMVVFGRVASFPWWPAVLSKCPRTELWVKEGKFWVFFFNDTTGAWLKSSEIRSFDSYNRDYCLEYNASNAKFKRYQDRILEAVKIAESHVHRGGRNILIPPLLVPVNGNESESSEEEQEPKPKKRESRRGKSNGAAQKAPLGRHRMKKASSRRRKESSLASLPEEGTNEQQEYVDEEQETIDGDNAAVDGRPQRKRVRSSRYEEFIAPFEEKNTARRRSTTPSPAVDLRSDLDMNKSGDAGDGPYPLNSQEKSSLLTSPRRDTKRSRRQMADPRKPVSDIQQKVGRQGRVSRHNTNREYVELERRHVSASEMPSLNERSKDNLNSTTPRYPSRERHRRSTRNQDKQQNSAALTREIYISELTKMVNPKQTPKRTRGSERPMHKVTRRVRSRVGTTSKHGYKSKHGDGTDSEERPERERKVTSGYLDAAAEDLVEHAVRGSIERRSALGDVREDILDMGSVALGGSDLVCSILNRLSDLEGDVKLLKQRAVAEEQSTLGEDVTAAGLKSSVEALAAASTAFAKARDYDTAVIGRALDVLWPDGHFPLTGADGDLLCTVARSLVLAACKRRMRQNPEGRKEAHIVESKEIDSSQSAAKRRRKRGQEPPKVDLTEGVIHLSGEAKPLATHTQGRRRETDLCHTPEKTGGPSDKSPEYNGVQVIEDSSPSPQNEKEWSGREENGSAARTPSSDREEGHSSSA